MKYINTETRVVYTRESAWKNVHYITHKYERDAEISEATGIETFRFTLAGSAGVIFDRGDEIEVRVNNCGRWDAMKYRVASESELDDFLDKLQRENDDLKTRVMLLIDRIKMLEDKQAEAK